MKKLLLKITFLVFFACAFGVSQEASAQYNTAIGLRAGPSNGLTVKHFINNGAALEGILHTRWRGLVITGLYEVHNDIREVKGLMWFYGGGAHLGTWNANNRNTPWGDSRNSATIVGLDAIIGLDYIFPGAPINLSLDWKPTINFGEAGFWGDEVALSIRFAF